MKKKRSILTILAVLAAAVGAFLAIGAYLKRKAERIGENLDFDNDLYYDDEDDRYYDEEYPDMTDSEEDVTAPAPDFSTMSE